MPFEPGDRWKGNRDGRAPDLRRVTERMAADAERAERAVESYQNQVVASLLMGREPPPLPSDYPSATECLKVDLRHLKASVEALRHKLERLPSLAPPTSQGKRRPAARTEAAIEAANRALARIDRETETALMSAGAALDRAASEDTPQ